MSIYLCLESEDSIMEFKAVARTIMDTLDLKRKYKIPRFQREYSWEEEEFTELWEDLLDSLIVIDKKLQPSEYFIGSLVLVGDDDDTKNIEREIVDGQQRLMTFTIMFSVLSQLFKEKNEDKLSSLVHSYIIGEDADGNEYTKIISETPKPFFQFRIQQKDIDLTQVPQSQEEKRILVAYEFFKNRLLEKNFKKDLYNRFPNIDIDYINMLKLFRDQILLCKVIYVTVKSFDDGYSIFEVLNAKGKGLTPVDIIKNSIFSILVLVEPVDYAYENWKKLRKNITESGIDDITIFYRHFWLSKYSFVTTKKLVDSFSKKIDKNQVAYKEFLENLIYASNDYVKFVVPKQSYWTQPEDRVVFETLEALNIFGITQVRTFLLALFEVKKKKLIKHSDFIKILNFLQYYHFVFNAICSKRPSGLERRYSSYSRQLRDALNTTESKKCIDDLLIALKETLPTYQEFEKKFISIFYTENNSKKKKLVQYILKKIDSYISGTNEMKIDSFSIEHILPESTKNKIVGCLGNLLPLGTELNNNLGDKSFLAKVEGYKKSQYKSVQNFLAEYCKDKNPKWTEDKITERTKELSRIMYVQKF